MGWLENWSGHSPFEGRWLALAYGIAEQLSCGELVVVAPDGSRRSFEGKEPGPEAEIKLNHVRAIRRFTTGGSLGFAEAYLDGDWDSPDLAKLLHLLALNEETHVDDFYGMSWYRWIARLQHLLRPNSKNGSRRNILAHYDLGNSFYERWLDPSMTYSSARFEAGNLTLEQAQRAKYESLAKGLALEPDHHVLEIGCGWGGFAEFAAGEVGAKVTAITISDEQHAFAAERIQAAGLNDKVEIRLQDYRDVDARFDRVASIEMFEAVGERYWPVYFGKLAHALKPGGVAGLQIITIADRYFEAYRRGVDFIQRHVFPGGMLPSPVTLDQQLKQVGLQKLSETTFGLDYAKTLNTGNQRFQAAWPEILPLGFDQRFKRLWEYYLAYCEAGFRVGWTDVAQLAVGRR
ncbi:MAG: class I SAM-dependent methyltransferase [Geminicoccaceae bacterium]